MSVEIAEATAFYVQVCQEHDRAFPLRNILVASVGYQKAEDKERFIADVREYLMASTSAVASSAQVTDRDPADD